MTRIPIAVLFLVGLGSAAGLAQDRLRAEFEAAFLAYDRGDYVPALEGLARILDASDGDAYVERIAQLTGERHPTIEITTDGNNARFSPNGRYILYERAGANGAITHIVRNAAGFRDVARIDGTRIAIAPDGSRLAYLRAPSGAEVDRVRTELERAIESGDREAIARWRDESAALGSRESRVVVRELDTGRERTVDTSDLLKVDLAWSADGQTLHLVAARDGEADRSDIYAWDGSGAPAPVTSGPGYKGAPIAVPGGRHLVYSALPRNNVPQRPAAGTAQRANADPARIVIRDLTTGAERSFDGGNPLVSRDGSALVFTTNVGGDTRIQVVRVAGGDPLSVTRPGQGGSNPAISPAGRTVAYQRMVREDWEIHVVGADGANGRRLTFDVQHDLFPQFVDERTVLVIKGEGRHRRSHLYDVETGAETRLFHNNTLRTISPEYQWVLSPDATQILIVAERDGDTISLERGVYLTDLSRTITTDDLRRRLAANLAAERDLRERGRAMYAPITDDVARTVERVSRTTLFDYQRSLYSFGSKFITQPGNRKAIDYLVETLESWGYEPELQWFEPRPGVPSANVLATLRGTTHPDRVYIVSSHFDSVERGPGADDNSSGTSMLLETARVLKDDPLPATVVFAFFTGEEAGLLGSREYTRRVGGTLDVVGALNNDMLGYANDHHLDNTIRYSNDGIRDVQHAAAFLFSDLVTYDARYYRSTDAHALYDAFGDVIGGIGSYPILANPHYHQPHDVLETIDQELVRETTRANVASIMLLASSPARLRSLEVVGRTGDALELRWEPAGETDVVEYVVAWGPEAEPRRNQTRVREPRARITGVAPGDVLAVKAVNRRGLESWDSARVVVTR